MNFPAANRGEPKGYRSIFAVKQRPPPRGGVLNPEVHNKGGKINREENQ